MAVDRYANDGVESHRTVRHRYDAPPPKPGEPAESDLDERSSARSAARAKAASPR